jgi:hypothetical protein
MDTGDNVERKERPGVPSMHSTYILIPFLTNPMRRCKKEKE